MRVKRTLIIVGWLFTLTILGIVSSHFYPGSQSKHVYALTKETPGHIETIEFDSTPDRAAVYRNLLIGSFLGLLLGLVSLKVWLFKLI